MGLSLPNSTYMKKVPEQITFARVSWYQEWRLNESIDTYFNQWLKKGRMMHKCQIDTRHHPKHHWSLENIIQNYNERESTSHLPNQLPSVKERSLMNTTGRNVKWCNPFENINPPKIPHVCSWKHYLWRKRKKQLKGPSTDQRINKMCYNHIVEITQLLKGVKYFLMLSSGWALETCQWNSSQKYHTEEDVICVKSPKQTNEKAK